MDDMEIGFNKTDEDDNIENGDDEIYNDSNHFEFDVEDLEAL